MARVSQAQLERALGGQPNLMGLVDKLRTGNPADVSVVTAVQEILDEGFAEVNSYICMAVDLADPALQTAPLLIRYELAYDVYLTWHKHTGGAAVPELIRAEYDKVVIELEKIGGRRKGVGLAVKPASGQVVSQVSKRDTEPYFDPRSPRRRFDGWS